MAQARYLITDTLEKFPKEGIVLQLTRNVHNVILRNRTNQAESPGKPTKARPIAYCCGQDRGKKGRKQRELWFSSFHVRGGPLLE